jgi:uncharacterized protein
MTLTEYAIVAIAAAAAGAVNALAGGGTLISFPALLAVGVPPVAANVTNTVALTPGYLGATLAQLQDLHGQRRRLWLLLPASVVGGIGGGLVLLSTSEQTFQALVPYLILGASALLAAQEPVRRWVVRRSGGRSVDADRWAVLPMGLAAVYGGYFGAGLSVIVLAVLGLLLDDTLTRLSAIKQAIAFAVNTAAALLFVFSGHTLWLIAGVMAVGSLAGGAVGGRMAGRIRPATLRATVVVIGTIVGVVYLVR